MSVWEVGTPSVGVGGGDPQCGCGRWGPPVSVWEVGTPSVGVGGRDPQCRCGR